MKENLFSSKQIIFFTVLFFVFNSVFAQINFSQNFNSVTSFPSADNWTAQGFNVTTTNACEGRSARGQFSSSGAKTLISPNQPAASNGNAVNINFKYKVINLSGSAAPSNFGSLEVQYSTNNGSSYATAYTINQANHIPSLSCATAGFSIPAGNIPAGSGFRLRFLANWAVGSYYVYIDDVTVVQNTGTPPACNAVLTSPANGAVNVPVTVSSLNWSAASGIPSGYLLRVGTTPGGSQVINNLNVGNVTSYPISLNYNQTYYVGITPYNANGNATGCTEQSFSTAAPVTATVPWEEGFQTTTLPEGWENSGFIIGTTTRLPGAETNVIFKNLHQSSHTASFSTVSVGEIQAGDHLQFIYRLGNFSPEPYNPPAAGSGNFIIFISTDFGVTYSDVATITNNGVAGWQEYELDLSAYGGEYVKIKITANRVSGDYYIGFDDFYIGSPITCPAAEDLSLEFVSGEQAQVSWSVVSEAENYNWLLFNAGADPANDPPVASGTVMTNQVTISDLSPNSDYDFYVQTDCDTNGLSYLSQVLSFDTACAGISGFPFTETFENDSSSRDCWTMEYVSGNSDWYLSSGAAGGSIDQAHSGAFNALFYFPSYAAAQTKLISPALDLSGLNAPVLSFWYANETGADPGDQNELRIYYKTSFNGSWTQIPGAAYVSNVNNWTQIELELPESSGDYYIAFEGTNHFGLGIVLDDITFYDSENCPSATIWDGLAWSNGLPDIHKKAVINGALTMDTDLTACELEVTESGSLEIPEGFTFTVNGMIRNHAPAGDFLVASGANLIQNENLDNTGQITVMRESQPMIRLDYTLWSSPVQGQNLFGFSPGTVNGVTNFPGSPGRIYIYDGSNGFVNPVPFDAETVMNEGTGYFFRAPNNWSSTEEASYPGKFIGTPTNGNISVHTIANNYTSIGNPYPSNIDLSLLIAANPGISTLYFWNNNHNAGNNYASCTSGVGCVAATGGGSVPNGTISAGQGFIVETSETSVNFDNSMRVADEAEFFKMDVTENHRFWLNFSNAAGHGYNQILIGYIPGATNGIDHQIDALLFGYSGSSLYSIINEGKYVIQGRALPFETTDVVPLGVKITTAGEFRITLAAFTGIFAEGQPIYLHDKYLGTVHNLSEEDYVFTSSTGEFNDRFDVIYDDFSSNCPATTIWNGLAWSNGLPGLDKKAVINAPFILNQNMEACELTVTVNGSLEIPSGFSFTVNGTITNQAAATDFMVLNDGNLIQIEDLENIGEITVVRESQPMVRLDYTLWSSPVTDQNLFNFSPMTVNGVTNHPGAAGRIYIYDGANGYVNPDPFTEEAVMGQGTGYLFRSPNNWSTTVPVSYEGIFTGVANNGGIHAATHAGDYTSVGNPYPSNITVHGLYAANASINTLYFWNNNHSTGNNYAACTNGMGCVAASGGGNTPNGVITTAQGFIVHTDAASLAFNNEMRVNDNGIFFRVDELESHRFRLNLDGEEERYNQILIGYVSEATNNVDAQIDGKLFNYEGSALYNLIDEEQFVIQGRALPFEISDVVPLGFRAAEGGKFKISLVGFDGLFAEGNATIYLKDNQMNITHNLMESQYEFESVQGEFRERFEVVYETESTMSTGDFDSNLVRVYQHDKQIIIESGAEKILSVELFDLSGRNIHRNAKVNASVYRIPANHLRTQVVIVKVQTANGEILSRKIITE